MNSVPLLLLCVTTFGGPLLVKCRSCVQGVFGAAALRLKPRAEIPSEPLI